MKKKIWLISILAVVLFTVLIFDRADKRSEKNFPKEEKIELENKPISYRFGLPVDSFEIIEATVKSGESFSNILLSYGVDYNKINSLAANYKEVFDVRKLRTGKPYSLFCDRTDSSKVAQYMVYQPSAVNYYVFELQECPQVYEAKKEVTTVTKHVSGVIKSSLYETLVQKGASPALTMELSDVYAWTIDFFRIRKGDYFKVIYEERFIDDTVSVGIGRILAAEFNHGQRSFYSFFYERDDANYYDYFDEKGNTLRKAFLRAPLKFSRISSRFSPRRFHPVLKRMKAHLGTDYAAPHGTPIMSTADGEVIKAGYTRGNGNYVKVKHNSTYTTQYLHMSKFAKGIKKGRVVKQGDVIGYVGSTGLATGPHVCYRFWKNGKQVDPLRQDLPEAEPIKPEYRDEYMDFMADLKAQLDAIPVEGIDTPEYNLHLATIR